MTAATCYLQPEQIFEWGTNVGKSARVFYEISKFFDFKSIIHSIDLPDEVSHIEHPNSKRGYLVKNCKNVFLHQGDGVTVAQKIYMQKPNAKTLVFVDGDHSYESVQNELSQINKVMPNAWILLHDTFYQSKQSDYNVGPYIAVQEFLAKNTNKYKTKFTDLGLPRMTLLYK